MIHSLVHSSATLIWVSLMLLCVIYMFCMLMMYGVCAEMSMGNMDEQLKLQVMKLFGDCPNSMLTLFSVITGGMDWSEVYWPLWEVSQPAACLLLFYVYFVIFGVVNVVTSVFVDAAHKASLSDREHVVNCELQRNKAYAKAVTEFFHDADTNDSGHLSWEELSNFLQSSKNKAHLATLDLDVTQARALYTLVDINRSNCVAIEDFVQGCQRLKGTAKAIDLSMLQFSCEQIMGELEHMLGELEQMGELLCKRLPLTPELRQKYSIDGKFDTYV